MGRKGGGIHKRPLITVINEEEHLPSKCVCADFGNAHYSIGDVVETTAA